MEEKVRAEEHPVPLWIKVMWGVFLLWALAYMALYWAPDLSRWMAGGDPDRIQWEG